MTDIERLNQSKKTFRKLKNLAEHNPQNSRE